VICFPSRLATTGIALAVRAAAAATSKRLVASAACVPQTTQRQTQHVLCVSRWLCEAAVTGAEA
jgi:hypothetical protein